ncbi:MAG TPA: TolC family protein, partial [Bacteroidales bacterium]|nr:TolC family protein [Bacteroidales bacterium]
MKRLAFLTILILPVLPLTAQQTVTLWQCYDSAAVISPLSGERELYAGMTLLRDRNLAAAWLPSLDLGGSFNYHSDVVDVSEMPGSMPVPPGSLPSIPHEQYRATVDLNQVIWDGGATRSAREVERVVSELNMQQSEADIYRLREQVNNLFFPILLVRSQAEVTAVLISELEARISEAESGVKNGVLLPVTLDVLNAEMIKAEQAAAELDRRHEALARALEQLTGMSGLKYAVLELPDHFITGNEKMENPDLQLFDIRSRQLELSKNLLKSQRMPRLFGF